MAQVLESKAPRAIEGEFDGFDYKPVPPLAPATLTVGILSGVAVFWDLALILPILGLLLGAACLWQIRRSEGLLGGTGLTIIGIAFSALFLIGGGSLHAYAYATECPPGFERVNFTSDIAAKGFVSENGEFQIHPDVKKLDEQPVFVKGYMYPTRQTEGIQSFVLCRDSGQCCFGGQPKLTDMILVEMPEDRAVNYLVGLVAIAGTFHTVNQQDAAGLNPVYRLEGEFFGPAKTTH